MLRFFTKRLRRNKKGFTLIELIVVIAILGVLALLAIPRLAGFRENAAFRADVASARTFATAAAAWHSMDPQNNTGDPTGDDEFLALLPEEGDFDFATQLHPGTLFEVEVGDGVGVDALALGDIEVTAGTSTLYPLETVTDGTVTRDLTIADVRDGY